MGFLFEKDAGHLKELIATHVKKSRLFEHTLEKLAAWIKRLEDGEKDERVMSVLHKEIHVEREDLRQLEMIKRYIEKVEQKKVEVLVEDGEVVKKLEEEHKLTKHQARSLLHQLALVKAYFRRRVKKDEEREGDLVDELKKAA